MGILAYLAYNCKPFFLAADYRKKKSGMQLFSTILGKELAKKKEYGLRCSKEMVEF